MKDRYVGTWWLSGRRDQTERGILAFVEDNLQLELLGTLIRTEARELSKDDTGGPVNIEGVSSDGKHIQLGDCFRISSNVTHLASPAEEGAVPHTLYRPSRAFITANSQFVRDTSLHFHRIAVGMTYLPDWVHRFRVDTSVPPAEDGTVAGIEAALRYLELPQVHVDGITIRLSQGFETEGDRTHYWTVRPKVWVWFEATEPLNVPEWTRTWIAPFQDFLTLMTGQTNHMTEVHGFHDMNRQPLQEPVSGKAWRDIPVEYVTDEIARHQRRTPPALPRHAAPYLLPDLEQHLEHTLATWYRVWHDTPAVFALTFGVERAPDHYISDQFLNLARAAEILHRAHGDNNYEPIPDFCRRRREIVDAVPEEYQAWLLERLQNANSPSFRERMRRLLASLPEITDDIPHGIGVLAKLVANNRNHLTHYSRPNPRWTLSGSDLYVLARVLLFVLKSKLLQQMNLDPRRLHRSPDHHHWTATLEVLLEGRGITSESG